MTVSKGLSKQERKEEKRRRKQERKSQRHEKKLAARRDVSYTGLLETSSVVQILEEIVASLKSGQVKVDNGEDQLTLQPRDVVQLKVTATQTHKGERLRMQLKWQSEPGDVAESELKISTD